MENNTAQEKQDIAALSKSIKISHVLEEAYQTTYNDLQRLVAGWPSWWKRLNPMGGSRMFTWSTQENMQMWHLMIANWIKSGKSRINNCLQRDEPTKTWDFNNQIVERLLAHSAHNVSQPFMQIGSLPSNDHKIGTDIKKCLISARTCCVATVSRDIFLFSV